MAEYLIQDSTLTAIANAIRVKTEKTDIIKTSNFAEEILSISVGSIGAFLTVTAPANVTVTATKDDEIFTGVTDSEGVATFEGLSSGTWTVTITNGSQTATKTVLIDTEYSVVLAFFQATISVNYPSGSTCTCSDGTTTLTAPNTSGSCVFTVPNAGTWTVSCTNGTNTATTEASITSDGQSKSVELTYELYLFNNGDKCTSVTGGWTTKSGESISVSVGSSAITFTTSSGSGRGAAAYTTNKIDTSKYTKMVVTGNMTTPDASEERRGLVFGLTSSKSESTPTNWVYAKTHDTKGTFELTLDISGANSSYYACVFAHASVVKVYSVMLE
jgi:hypothetical protein